MQDSNKIPVSRSEIVAKLEKELAAVSWEHLRPHLERDALICVDRSLDMVSIGTDVAMDNSPVISKLITEKKLYKPYPDQIDAWSNSGNSFQCLIVSPYVLIQELPDS